MATEGTTLLDAPPIVTIESERLVLSTLLMSDLEGLKGLTTHPDVMKWTSIGVITSRSQGERWLSERALGADVYQFAVRLRSARDSDQAQQQQQDKEQTSSPDRIIGLVGSFQRPKCGYLFDPDFHGKGYATEALRAFLAAFWAHVPSAAKAGDIGSSEGGTPVDYLEAWTDVENVRSQRVLLKCGFRRGATIANECELPMLGMRSSVVFHLPRPGMTLDEVGIAPDGSMIAPGTTGEERLVPPVE